MATFEQLAADLYKISIKTSENVHKVVRLVALAADQALVMGTPVDTSRARSNWLVSCGEPRDDTIEPYVPGKGGSSAAASSQAALEQGKQEIEASPVGATIYISNNLPYITKLNEGWSRQAPSGFVEKAIEEAAVAVESAYP